MVKVARMSLKEKPALPRIIEWLTAKEAAAYLRAKIRSLLLWARPGMIKGYALSGTKRHLWRFRREDLDAAQLAHPVSYRNLAEACASRTHH